MDSILTELKTLDQCDLDFISELRSNSERGRLNGTYQGIIFVVSYSRKEYVLLTVNVAQGDTYEAPLRTLCEICTTFMGQPAICQYEEDDPERLTIEWDVCNPEQRLRDVANQGGNFAKMKIKNVKFLGKYQLSDFEDATLQQKNAEQEAERIKNARILGVDPGGLDVEAIEKMPEWELFLLYYSITLQAWRLDHDSKRDYSRGHIEKSEFATMQQSVAELSYPINYLLYFISKKIGVQVPEPKVDQPIQPDREQFMKWYRFYDHHFMHEMSDEEYARFEAKRKQGEDISEFLPEDDWHDYQG